MSCRDEFQKNDIVRLIEPIESSVNGEMIDVGVEFKVKVINEDGSLLVKNTKEKITVKEEDFAKLMNVYAENMGMLNTNFINSSGRPDENHFSTVRDLAILSNAIAVNTSRN